MSDYNPANHSHSSDDVINCWKLGIESQPKSEVVPKAPASRPSETKTMVRASEDQKKTEIPPQEAYDYFYARTQKHIFLVRDNLYLWTEKYPQYNELNQRAVDHDLSKFYEPEKTPYIWRTWQSYCTLNNIPFKYPPGMEQQTRDAIFHHITHNRHHPEWHPDPDEMTNIDLIEMVCDWTAMSQEFGDKSAMGWADRVLGRRFHFSDRKCGLIRDYIREMDIMNQNKGDK